MSISCQNLLRNTRKMAVWSSFARSLERSSQYSGLFKKIIDNPASKNAIVRSMSDHGPRTIPMMPSRFQWNKFKDLFHYYVMLGLIPGLAIVFYANVFVGPATLTETPEGYTPKHWEYHRHPISRFIARYIHPTPQQDYEKMCHLLYEENEKAQIRQLEKEVRAKMSERNDYQAYYYRPAIGKYHRISKEAADYLESIQGD